MRAASRRAATLVACLWGFFILRGLFFVTVLPLWEGFDEWSHYAVVENIAIGRSALLPAGDPVSREVQASLELAPIAWQMAPLPASLRQDEWWRRPEVERTRRELQLRSLPAAWASQPGTNAPPAHEAQQAPVYYWLFALFYRVGAGLSLLARVWALRFTGLVLASSIVPLTFLLARNVLRDDLRALSAAAIVASLPELMILSSPIGNHGLAVAAGGLSLLAFFRWKEEPRSSHRAVESGLALGLALLTKAYFLALIPPVLIFTAMITWQKRVFRQAFALIAAAGLVSGWWYVRNWITLGSLSGEEVDVPAIGQTKIGLLKAVATMNWAKALDFALLSHIWLGGWSFLVARSWMYHTLEVVMGLALIGLLRLFVLRRRSDIKRDIAFLFSVYLTFILALGYQSMRAFQSLGFPGTPGYYLFAIAAAEAILLCVGLEEIAPRRFAAWMVPGYVASLAAVELFSIHFYSIPYYTGFIAHLPNGNLPTLKISQLGHGGLKMILTRLAVNKPGFIESQTIAAAWVLYLISTAGLVAVTVYLARARFPRSSDAAIGRKR